MAVNSLNGTSHKIAEQLQECALLLTQKLHDDEYEEASILINNLMAARDRYIFQSVGELTRGLHNAIVNFNVDNTYSQTSEENEIKDASNRLNYVIELTQNAANKTMDMVEESAPIANDLAEKATELKARWIKLRNREMNVDDFRSMCILMDDFFDYMDKGTHQLNTNLQNIILEQGFQDLTGQVLKKVITMVADVEASLVSLVRIAAEVENITGIKNEDVNENDKNNKDIEAQGPLMNAEQREDVVCGQDDVDDLLSSLGF